MTSDVIQRDIDVLGGTSVFRGTRVPGHTLFDYLEGGQTRGEFLHDFPAVTHIQVAEVLATVKGKLLAEVG